MPGPLGRGVLGVRRQQSIAPHECDRLGDFGKVARPSEECRQSSAQMSHSSVSQRLQGEVPLPWSRLVNGGESSQLRSTKAPLHHEVDDPASILRYLVVIQKRLAEEVANRQH